MPDERFIRIALAEARKGLGHTSPNPAVGAVIVRNGRILAKGYHHEAGLPHAEIEAIRGLKNPELSRGATLYVTLEPCSTHGRTPPCVKAIIDAKVARVVIGTIDPNPKHAGRGVELLRRAGIEVTTDVLEVECREINRAFNHWIVNGIPWVMAKAGLSVDGRLTRPPGEGQWLTSKASRADAMQLRAQVDAIMIGAGTLRADDPLLTIRGIPEFKSKQPWRVIVAGKHPLPKRAKVFTDAHRAKTLIYRRKSLRAILADLGRRGITSLLIEGGGTLLGAAFDQRLVNEVRFYIAPILSGGPDVINGLGAASTAESLRIANANYRTIGSDLVLTGLVAA